MDDYFKITWVFKLKRRSKEPHTFQAFYNEIKKKKEKKWDNQFEISICILHSNNAFESQIFILPIVLFIKSRAYRP